MFTVIHPQTGLGRVSLTIRDMTRSLDYYCERLGLKLHRREDRRAYLGTGGPDLLVLEENPAATSPKRHTGLYHFALRLPTRADWNRLLQTAGPDKPDLQLKGLAPGGNSQLNLTPSGQRNALGNYVGFGDRGSYWGAVMGEEIEGSLWQFDFSRGTVSEERAHPEVGASCRCVKE